MWHGYLSTPNVLKGLTVLIDTLVAPLCIVEVIVEITGISDGYLPVLLGLAGYPTSPPQVDILIDVWRPLSDAPCVKVRIVRISQVVSVLVECGPKREAPTFCDEGDPSDDEHCDGGNRADYHKDKEYVPHSLFVFLLRLISCENDHRKFWCRGN